VVAPPRDDLSPALDEERLSLRSERRVHLPVLSEPRRIPYVAIGWGVLILVVLGVIAKPFTLDEICRVVKDELGG